MTHDTIFADFDFCHMTAETQIVSEEKDISGKLSILVVSPGHPLTQASLLSMILKDKEIRGGNKDKKKN